MVLTFSKQSHGFVWALLFCALAYPAKAADQVLTCQPLLAKGQEVRILISQGVFAKGRILWPSQAGTTVFDIREKTSVSYRAEQSPPALGHRAGGVLCTNRLNGDLHYTLSVTPKTADALASVCKSSLSPDERALPEMAWGSPALSLHCFDRLQQARPGRRQWRRSQLQLQAKLQEVLSPTDRPFFDNAARAG